jgi:hypothetical protein
MGWCEDNGVEYVFGLAAKIAPRSGAQPQPGNARPKSPMVRNAG